MLLSSLCVWGGGGGGGGLGRLSYATHKLAVTHKFRRHLV